MILNEEFFCGWDCKDLKGVVSSYGLIGKDIREIFDILYQEDLLYCLWGLFWMSGSYYNRVICCSIIVDNYFEKNMYFNSIREYISFVLSNNSKELSSREFLLLFNNSIFESLAEEVLEKEYKRLSSIERFIYNVFKFLVYEDFVSLQSCVSVAGLLDIEKDIEFYNSRKHFIRESIKRVDVLRDELLLSLDRESSVEK